MPKNPTKVTLEDLEAARREIPHLITQVDMAEMFDLQQMSVYQWRIRGILPPPVRTYGKTPVWRYEEIVEWAKQTGREIVSPLAAA